MQSQDKRRLSELLTTLSMIEKMKKNKKEAKEAIEKIAKVRERARQAILLKTEGGKVEGEIEKFNIQLAGIGNSIADENLEHLLAYKIQYAMSALVAISEESLPKELSGPILEALEKGESIDVSTFEKKVRAHLGDEKYQDIEIYTAEINTSEPSKELVKTFIIATEAIAQTIKDLNAAIATLDSFLDNTFERHSQLSASAEKEETNKAVHPNSEQKEEKKPLEKSTKTEEEKIEEEVEKEFKDINKNVNIFGEPVVEEQKAEEKETVPIDVEANQEFLKNIMNSGNGGMG